MNSFVEYFRTRKYSTAFSTAFSTAYTNVYFIMKNSNLSQPIQLFLVLSFIPLTLISCAPKVYILERQTLLEEQSLGKWPEFEEKYLKDANPIGPNESAGDGKKISSSPTLNPLNGDWAPEEKIKK